MSCPVNTSRVYCLPFPAVSDPSVEPEWLSGQSRVPGACPGHQHTCNAISLSLPFPCSGHFSRLKLLIGFDADPCESLTLAEQNCALQQQAALFNVYSLKH